MSRHRSIQNVSHNRLTNIRNINMSTPYFTHVRIPKELMKKQSPTVSWISESTLVLVGSQPAFPNVLCFCLINNEFEHFPYNIHIPLPTYIHLPLCTDYLVYVYKNFIIVWRWVRFCFSLSLCSYRSLRRRRRRCYRRNNIITTVHMHCVYYVLVATVNVMNVWCFSQRLALIRTTGPGERSKVRAW